MNHQTIELFSLPDTFFQLSKMLNDPRYTADDFGSVISKDPALSIRLLKIVNSPYYGFPSRIDTISRAITIVGIDDLQNLILATSVVDTFDSIPDDLVDMTSFWFRSVNCAVIAKILAEKCAVLHAERLFIAGLLHDIGSLIIYSQFPEESKKILEKSNYDRQQIVALENQMIGFSHIDVGAELLRHWGLPNSLSESVMNYMKPEKAGQYQYDACILNLATFLCDLVAPFDKIAEIVAKISKQVFSILSINHEDIEEILLKSEQELSLVFSMLVPNQNST